MRIASRARRVVAPPIVSFKDRHRARLAGPGCIDLSQAVPSHEPPPPVLEELARAAADPTTARYTPDPGLPECRERVAAYLRRRHRAQVAPEHVLITPGANAAFHFAANVLLDVGDTASLLSPYYFNHHMSVELLGGTAAEVRLPMEIPVARAIDAGALDGVERSGVLVVVNPGNPTGRCLDRDDLGAILAWASAHGVRLVVDETYLEFHPVGSEPATVLSFEGWSEHAVAIGTFSKSLSITGHRVGYLCGDPSVLGEVLKVQDSAVVCAPHPGQRAVMAALAWSDLDDWLDGKRREIDERVRTFVNVIESTDGPFVVESAGAFFAYLESRGRDTGGEEGVADRVAREANVVCLPGSPFGRNEGSRLRVAVGNAAPGELREAATRMQRLGSR